MPDKKQKSPIGITKDGLATKMMGWFGFYKRPIDSDVSVVADDSVVDLHAAMSKLQSLAGKRKEKYDLWEQMDEDLCASIADIYAEEMTATDYATGQSIWPEAKDKRVASAVADALRNVGIEDCIQDIARNGAVQGDEFYRHLYRGGSDGGVLGWRRSDPRDVTRHEDSIGRLIGFSDGSLRFRGERKYEISWPWDYTHLRYPGPRKDAKYGTSLFYNMFRANRQLQFTEDAILRERLRRSGSRNLIKLDVGGLSPHEQQRKVNELQNKLRRSKAVDPNSGSYKKSLNVVSADEDIVVPVRGSDDVTDVQQLQGSGEVGDMPDLDNWRKKLFGAARVPGAYLGYAGDDINSKCGALTTRVPCLDGKTRTLGQIIKRFEKDGWLPYVYAWDAETGKVVPGQVTHAAITRPNAEVLEVELDDGTRHKFTPDHRWFLLDGTQVRTDELQPGQQLMPLRTALMKWGGQPYRKVYDPYGTCMFLHRRVAETVYPSELASTPNAHVHHRNRKPHDNDPRNVQVLSHAEHMREHEEERVARLDAYRKENGVWNKGITKQSDDPRAASLRKSAYPAKQRPIKERLKITKSCLGCGDEFATLARIYPSDRERRFCSAGCASVWGNRARVEAGRVVMRCEYCELEYETFKSRVDDGKDRFCSRRCYSAACVLNRKTACKYCSNDFTKKRNTSEFCSNVCANTYRNKLRAGKLPLPNHTVVAVRKIEPREDTGDITVAGYRNFFVADAKEGGVLVHNSTLTTQDVRFARGIKRARRALIQMIRQTTDLHLLLIGMMDTEQVTGDYVLQMAPISALDESERLLLVQTRTEVLTGLASLNQILSINPVEWTRYLLINYARLDEDLVDKLMKKAELPPVDPNSPAAAQQGDLEAVEKMVGVRHGKLVGDLTESDRKLLHVVLNNSPMLQGLMKNANALCEPENVQQVRYALPFDRSYRFYSDDQPEDAQVDVLLEHAKSFLAPSVTEANALPAPSDPS